MNSFTGFLHTTLTLLLERQRSRLRCTLFAQKARIEDSRRKKSPTILLGASIVCRNRLLCRALLLPGACRLDAMQKERRSSGLELRLAMKLSLPDQHSPAWSTETLLLAAPHALPYVLSSQPQTGV